MDPQLILAAINTGMAIFKAADPNDAAKAAGFVNAGSSIISSAVGLFNHAKGDLSASDVALVDAAVERAHAECGTDLARVLGELDAAAQH